MSAQSPSSQKWLYTGTQDIPDIYGKDRYILRIEISV